MARKAAKRKARAARHPAPRARRREQSRALTAGGLRILNCVPSRDTEKDWRIETAEAAGMLGVSPIPAAKDLREKWWTINNQGSTGSCVGWATADSVLRWHFVKAGRLSPKAMLSPRFIWMAAKETDEFDQRPTTFIEADGTSLKAALDIARRYGAVEDRLLPFGTGRLFPDEASTFYAVAAQLKIASYINLGRNLAQWRR